MKKLVKLVKQNRVNFKAIASSYGKEYEVNVRITKKSQELFDMYKDKFVWVTFENWHRAASKTKDGVFIQCIAIIDYDAPRVETNEKKVEVSFKYDEDKVNVCRKSGGKWNKDKKVWLIDESKVADVYKQFKIIDGEDEEELIVEEDNEIETITKKEISLDDFLKNDEEVEQVIEVKKEEEILLKEISFKIFSSNDKNEENIVVKNEIKNNLKENIYNKFFINIKQNKLKNIFSNKFFILNKTNFIKEILFKNIFYKEKIKFLKDKYYHIKQKCQSFYRRQNCSFFNQYITG